ncbi:MAG: hypothetical protein QF805_03720 [Pirellulaceae bacterium]|jgi:type II secretory pathway component PulC|nr:hypothetical protein [Pirellulaceae bacterium]
MGKLAKRLTTDLKRSPLKTGFLAIMTVVAIYFWAPLVGSIFGKEKNAAATKAQPTVATSATPATAATTAANAAVTQTESTTKSTSAMTWQNILKQRDDDETLRPRAVAVERNPFVWTTAALAVIEANSPSPAVIAEASPQAELSPSDVGLQFRGSMIGARRRVATINGRSYLEGSMVEADSQLDGEVSFLLARVLADKVVLERNGREFELPLRRKKNNWRVSSAGQ